ncbi:MAG: transcriptional repressor [Lachnospiraceae bacterium]|nr:transcriptional repressor [Lachnospiraceae bacterium]
MQVKYSRQREAILHFLESRRDHPTADVIYAHLKMQDPKISLGTVYRNLSLLTELGKIRTFATGDGKEHYDPNTSAHSHLICRSCGSVSDVDVICPETTAQQAENKSGGRVEDSQLFFYGQCEKCAGK